MLASDTPTREEDLHEQVERKLIKIFGVDRGSELLRGLLVELKLPAVASNDELVRLADLLQTRQGFERTAGAMLAVMAAVRQSKGR